MAMKKLSNLRLFFILYLIIKLIVELVFGSGFYEDSLQDMPVPEFVKSPVTFVITTLLSNGFLILIGLLFFYYLLQKKNWARIVLIIIGLLNVVDAITGLLFNTKLTAFITQFISPQDWGQILYLDRITDIIGLIFWGYAVYLLMGSEEVKELFSPVDQNGTNNQE